MKEKLNMTHSKLNITTLIITYYISILNEHVLSKSK